MPKKKTKKPANNAKTKSKNNDTKSDLLQVKTTDSPTKSSPDGSGTQSPASGSGNSSANATPNLTPYLLSKTLADMRPVNEPTPASTPRLSTQKLPSGQESAPVMFPSTQLTEEEKVKAAQVAALKESEARENEIRKRASAERYKQLAKDQALASREVKLDPREFNREKLKEQAAAEERRRSQLRENIQKKTAKNSDLALKLVILVWIVIVVGIFWHVYSTIRVGRIAHSSSSFRPGAQHLPSSRSR